MYYQEMVWNLAPPMSTEYWVGILQNQPNKFGNSLVWRPTTGVLSKSLPNWQPLYQNSPVKMSSFIGMRNVKGLLRISKQPWHDLRLWHIHWMMGSLYLIQMLVTAIGAVLSQVQNGQERVVAYASRVLNKAERNYCVTDKELLAVKHFIEYFYQYLADRHFLVRTDHQPLKWLFSLKAPRGRIARWLLILSGYNFSIEYRKGVKHGNADAMSRCPNPKDCECVFEDDDSALKCGPCAKCLHRSEVMESEWSCMSGPLKVNRVAVDLFNEMEDGVKIARSKDFSDGEHNTLTDSYTEMCCGYMFKLQPFMVWLASVLMVVTVCGGHVDWLMLTAISGGIFLLRLVKDMQDCGGFAVVRSAVPCVWFQGYTHTELKRLQEQDSVLSVVIGWLKMGKIPSIKDVCGKRVQLCDITGSTGIVWKWEKVFCEGGILSKMVQAITYNL